MIDPYAAPNLCGSWAENGYVTVYLVPVDVVATGPG